MPTYPQDSLPVDTVWPEEIIEVDVEAEILAQTKKKYEEPNTTSILCNCYAFVDSVVDLPHSMDVLTNLEESGNVAVFYYPESGLYHYALVTNTAGSTITISETNYSHCEYSQRIIRADEPGLIGFYNA